MPSLKEVRGRILSVNSTQQITKAMKMVAAAKLRRAQENIMQMRPYSRKLSNILQNLSAGLEIDDLENQFGIEREVKKVLIVAITSDRGLCGAFNTNVFRTFQGLISEKYKKQADTGNVYVLPIGRKSLEYFNKREKNVITQFSGVMSKPAYVAVREIASYIMDSFVKGDFDRVEIVYNEFKNVATQIIRAEQFLPIISEKVEKVVVKDEMKTEYIFEPSKSHIVKELIPESLKVQFYKSVLESAASEQGARMTAMDKATENAGDLLKELKLTYNRTRQAAITKEILEIVGGAEALKSGR